MSTTSKFIALIVTPVVSAYTAWLVTWGEQHIPGHPHLDKSGISALAVAGAIAGAGSVIHLLHVRHDSKVKLNQTGT